MFDKGIATKRSLLISAIESKQSLSADCQEQFVSLQPSSFEWLNLFKSILFWLGYVSTGCAVIFFVAANWQGLHYFAKFALVQGLIVIATVGYARYSSKPKIQQGLLLLAMLAVGALMALFGQTYQSGADPWQLFFSWAMLTLPWVLVSRLASMWLLWIGLLYLALLLYIDGASSVVAGNVIDPVFFSACLVAWEFASTKFVWLKRTWAINLLGLCSGIAATALFVDSLWGEDLLGVLIWLVWAVAVFLFYRFQQLNVALLTVLAVCALFVVNAGIIRMIGDEFVRGAFLLLVLVTLGMGTGFTIWLKGLSRQGILGTSHLVDQDNCAVENQCAVDDIDKQGQTAPSNDADQSQSPWYIKLFMAFAGWLASIFVFSFVASFLLLADSNNILVSVSGILLIVIGWWILKEAHTEFSIHAGLATSFAGQGFVIWALFLFGLFDNGGLSFLHAWGLISVMHLLLAVFIPNYLHKLMSAYFGTLTFSLFLAEAGISQLYSSILLLCCAILWLNEFKLAARFKHIQAIGFGITVGLIQFKTSLMFIASGTWDFQSVGYFNQYIDDGLNLVILGYVVFLLLKQKPIVQLTKLLSSPLLTPNNGRLVGALLVLFLGLVTALVSGVAVGLVLMLMAFSTKNRTLFVLGVIACIINLSSYYYLLEITLLYKSMFLLILGIFAIALSIGLKQIAQAVQAITTGDTA